MRSPSDLCLMTVRHADGPPDLSTRYPVAIVGAGPIGLTVANLLTRYGVSCVVIEQAAGVATHPRAQVIDDESMRTLQVFDCAHRFEPMVRPAQASNYYDENNAVFARIGVGPKNYGFFKRCYMLQQQLDRLLLQRLTEQRGTSVRFNTRLRGLSETIDGVTLELDNGELLCCDYVLACDGGQSPIRKSLGISMKGWTYEQDWIVLDALDDPDTEAVSRFFCNPARPMVSIASPNNGRRYEFMLLPGEDRDTVLSDDYLAELLRPYRSWDPAKITRRAVYTFHARIAEKLCTERIMLLGDAAHLTPPFAGQGMNAGMRDALNVAWKLGLVVNQGASKSILQSYETERRDATWAMIQVAVAMGEFCMPVGDEQIALKSSVMKALERFPQARDWLFNMRFKPVPRFDIGLVVDAADQPFEAALVGEMLPQPEVVDANGQRGLLDNWLGDGFALLVQDAALIPVLQELDHPVWRAIKPRAVWLRTDVSGGSGRSVDDTQHPANCTGGVTALTVVEPADYARPIRTHRDQVMLIRPDRYVAGAFFAANAAGFADKLATVLGLAGPPN